MVFELFCENKCIIFLQTEGAVMPLHLCRNVAEGRGRVYGRWSIKF